MTAPTVTVTQPPEVTIALYLRDRLQIPHTGDHPLPPTDPAVDGRPHSFGAELVPQWNAWWGDLLTRLDVSDPGAAAEPWPTVPPGTALASALSATTAEARAWSGARKLEFAPPPADDGPAGRIARAVGAAHVPQGTGRLTVLVLPLRGHDLHRVTDRLLVVPTAAGLDRDGTTLRRLVRDQCGPGRHHC